MTHCNQAIPCPATTTLPTTRWMFRSYWRSVRLRPLVVGDRVDVLSSSQHPTVCYSAHLRYLGQIHCARGSWAGLELDRPCGKGIHCKPAPRSFPPVLRYIQNDGSIEGRQYFLCGPCRGIFVRTERCRKQRASVPRATCTRRTCWSYEVDRSRRNSVWSSRETKGTISASVFYLRSRHQVKSVEDNTDRPAADAPRCTNPTSALVQVPNGSERVDECPESTAAVSPMRGQGRYRTTVMPVKQCCKDVDTVRVNIPLADCWHPNDGKTTPSQETARERPSAVLPPLAEGARDHHLVSIRQRTSVGDGQPPEETAFQQEIRMLRREELGRNSRPPDRTVQGADKVTEFSDSSRRITGACVTDDTNIRESLVKGHPRPRDADELGKIRCTEAVTCERVKQEVHIEPVRANCVNASLIGPGATRHGDSKPDSTAQARSSSPERRKTDDSRSVDCIVQSLKREERNLLHPEVFVLSPMPNETKDADVATSVVGGEISFCVMAYHDRRMSLSRGAFSSSTEYSEASRSERESPCASSAAITSAGQPVTTQARRAVATRTVPTMITPAELQADVRRQRRSHAVSNLKPVCGPVLSQGTAGTDTSTLFLPIASGKRSKKLSPMGDGGHKSNTTANIYCGDLPDREGFAFSQSGVRSNRRIRPTPSILDAARRAYHDETSDGKRMDSRPEQAIIAQYAFSTTVQKSSSSLAMFPRSSTGESRNSAGKCNEPSLIDDAPTNERRRGLFIWIGPEQNLREVGPCPHLPLAASATTRSKTTPQCVECPLMSPVTLGKMPVDEKSASSTCRKAFEETPRSSLHSAAANGNFAETMTGDRVLQGFDGDHGSQANGPASTIYQAVILRAKKSSRTEVDCGQKPEPPLASTHERSTEEAMIHSALVSTKAADCDIPHRSRRRYVDDIETKVAWVETLPETLSGKSSSLASTMPLSPIDMGLPSAMDQQPSKLPLRSSFLAMVECRGYRRSNDTCWSDSGELNIIESADALLPPPSLAARRRDERRIRRQLVLQQQRLVGPSVDVKSALDVECRSATRQFTARPHMERVTSHEPSQPAAAPGHTLSTEENIERLLPEPGASTQPTTNPRPTPAGDTKYRQGQSTAKRPDDDSLENISCSRRARRRRRSVPPPGPPPSPSLIRREVSFRTQASVSLAQVLLSPQNNTQDEVERGQQNAIEFKLNSTNKAKQPPLEPRGANIRGAKASFVTANTNDGEVAIDLLSGDIVWPMLSPPPCDARRLQSQHATTQRTPDNGGPTTASVVKPSESNNKGDSRPFTLQMTRSQQPFGWDRMLEYTSFERAAADGEIQRTRTDSPVACTVAPRRKLPRQKSSSYEEVAVSQAGGAGESGATIQSVRGTHERSSMEQRVEDVLTRVTAIELFMVPVEQLASSSRVRLSGGPLGDVSCNNNSSRNSSSPRETKTRSVDYRRCTDTSLHATSGLAPELRFPTLNVDEGGEQQKMLCSPSWKNESQVATSCDPDSRPCTTPVSGSNDWHHTAHGKYDDEPSEYRRHPRNRTISDEAFQLEGGEELQIRADVQRAVVQDDLNDEYFFELGRSMVRKAFSLDRRENNSSSSCHT